MRVTTVCCGHDFQSYWFIYGIHKVDTQYIEVTRAIWIARFLYLGAFIVDTGGVHISYTLFSYNMAEAHG